MGAGGGSTSTGGDVSAAGGKNSADNSSDDEGFSLVKGKQNRKGVKRQEARDESGLSANRQRGFSSQVTVKPNTRVPTTNLHDMQAKEGSLVSKFMTFLCWKNTFVVDLYEAVFFRSKPTFDVISEFIFKDLCADLESKRALVDVQLHPVKMLLFIKFNSEESRDAINEKVQSTQGVIWSHSYKGI